MLFIRRRHPVEKVHMKMQGLVAAWNGVLPQLRVMCGQRSRVTHDFSAPNSSLRRLQGVVDAEFMAWSADGETSHIETKNIADCFWLFPADLKRLQESLATADQHLADNILRDVVRAANQLVGAIMGLQERVASRRMRVVRHHTDYPEQFLKIRDSLARINPQAAKELRGMEVDSWCEWPGVDLICPYQVDQLARLVLLSQLENQFYELRCRSSAPGRPLKLMDWFPDFPTEEDVFTCAELCKRPDKIYVAAAKPTWRIVWVFDRETERW